ncbi:MAG: TIGR03618 family F420-dependent PPOX class oxidoreductase [Chloroflexi bacterium]|nr:TIGR03618 family F420-dependent PPOX class oxidoreductase [Chloroflexota bacterium]
MAVPIPDDFRDLLDRPIVVALVTVMPDGQPQATPVWVDFDGTYIGVNSKRGRQKDKNMTVGAKVTVLSIDPNDTSRWLEVRGRVAVVTEEGALEHANALSLKYDGNPDFFAPYPERRGKETRVTYKIEPLRVNTSD